MHFDTKLRLYGDEALWRRQPGLGGFEIGDEGHHLGGELVAVLWAAGTWHEAGQTRRRKCALSLVEGRPGDAE